MSCEVRPRVEERGKDQRRARPGRGGIEVLLLSQLGSAQPTD